MGIASFTAMHSQRRWAVGVHHATTHLRCVMHAALLQGGANPNQPNKDVTSALHAAAQRGPVRLVQLLLQHKADPLAVGDQGWTPLHLAARAGNAQKVKCLLQAGAKHDTANSQGNTALHLVSFRQLLLVY